jgi:acetyl esterase/lipase
MAPGYPEERDRYRSLGWTIYNVDYHSGGARAYADLQSFYTELRAQLPDETICAAGGSAGAHLSLLLAARNDDLDCAIALAGPTNLATDAAFTTGAAAAITAAFGPEGDGVAWAENSPALQVGGGFATRTFLRVAANDPLVAASQQAEFADAVAAVPGAPAVDHQVLADGGPWYGTCWDTSTFFIHACVPDAAYDAYLADETAFLNSVGAG